MEKRVVIVDYNHMVHQYLHGGAKPLSHTVMVDGKPRIIDTTVQAYTIKALHRWSNKGANPLAVCFDSPISCRKVYFAKQYSAQDIQEGKGYKAGRSSFPDQVYDAINMVANLLIQAGVSVYKARNYEADDLVFACVENAKALYPDLKIDIITNDTDLLPLVDDQVSVFMRSRKYTWAENSDIEKKNYVQVTPYNYQEFVQGLTKFKNLFMPYNSILLAKLLRGDDADGILGHPDYKPRHMKQLIAMLEDDGQPIEEIFRYGENTETIVYKATGEPVPEHLINSIPEEQKEIKYGDPEVLTEMLGILSNYIEDDDLDHVRFVYNGLNLNTAFPDLPSGSRRRPANIVNPIKSYYAGDLQYQVSVLNIRLPI